MVNLPGPEVIKKISCSTQLSKIIILLINDIMPTVVGIFTYIRMVNITFERLKAGNVVICQRFSVSVSREHVFELTKAHTVS